jgi:hypothetical protein
MRLRRSALIGCLVWALFACSGHLKPVVLPVNQNTDSAATLLRAMHFDVAVTQFIQRVEDATRLKVAALVEKQPMNAEQRRLFDEMTDQLVGVIHFEYS